LSKAGNNELSIIDWAVVPAGTPARLDTKFMVAEERTPGEFA
jgi:hypothetical protein